MKELFSHVSNSFNSNTIIDLLISAFNPLKKWSWLFHLSIFHFMLFTLLLSYILEAL